MPVEFPGETGFQGWCSGRRAAVTPPYSGLRTHPFGLRVQGSSVLEPIALVVGVSVGLMLVDFQPEQRWWFIAVLLVFPVTYGLIGMLVDSVFDRLSDL